MKTQKISTLTIAIVTSCVVLVGVAIADQIYNNIDTTIDSSYEVMDITAGGSGSVTFRVHPTTGGGDSVTGCNLSSGTKSATFNVLSSDESIATVSPASITFTGPGCSDAETVTVTGVAAGSATISLSEASNGTGGSFNVSPAAFTVNVSAPAPSDTTPPEIFPTVTPEANEAGWHNTDVTVSWSFNDGESAITSTEGCDEVTLTDETAGTVLTCTATSAGGTASESVTVKIDKTKPVITGTSSPSANEAGWNKTDVEVIFACAEIGAVQSGISTNTVAGATLTTEGAGQSVTNTGSCVDAAGNEADSATVSGINIDKTAPDVLITTPLDGGSYTFKQTVLADWSATDALSGIESAVGTAATSTPIDTSSIGTKFFTVTATDVAGNINEVTVSYSVVPYTFGGFGPPLIISRTDFKKMSTIPVKFKLSDTFGNPVSNAIATLKVNGVVAVASGGSNIGNYFRYDPTGMQYIFNLSTKPLALGTNTLVVTLDDGTSYSWTITIR